MYIREGMCYSECFEMVSLMIHRPVPLGQIIHYVLNVLKNWRSGHRHPQRVDHMKIQGDDGHLQAMERDLRSP